MATAYVTIYGLVDPRTGELRYVGKSIHPELRMREHLDRARNRPRHRRDYWIRKLLIAGFEPVMIDLEIVDSDLQNDAEKSWIRFLKDIGLPLTNMSEGGDGGPIMKGRRHSEEARAKMAAAARMRPKRLVSESTKAKLRAINSGRPKSEEHKRKLSAALRGRPGQFRGKTHTEVTKMKIRYSKRHRSFVDQIQESL